MLHDNPESRCWRPCPSSWGGSRPTSGGAGSSPMLHTRPSDMSTYKQRIELSAQHRCRKRECGVAAGNLQTGHSVDVGVDGPLVLRGALMLRRNWWNLLRARRQVPRLGALGRCSRLPCPNHRRSPHM